MATRENLVELRNELQKRAGKPGVNVWVSDVLAHVEARLSGTPSNADAETCALAEMLATLTGLYHEQAAHK